MMKYLAFADSDPNKATMYFKAQWYTNSWNGHSIFIVIRFFYVNFFCYYLITYVCDDLSFKRFLLSVPN